MSVSSALRMPLPKIPKGAVLRKLRRLSGHYRGMVAAVEPDSGEYFLARDALGAIHKAWKSFPGHYFYLLRIGYPGVDSHRGALKPVRSR